MKAAPALEIRFWGVRGSHPVPGPTTAKVGGNSSCVQVSAGGHTLIFDAGTGIIPLGRELVHDGSRRALHIFLSHLHHDHIEGLRFFEPLYFSDWRCDIYGPASLAEVIKGTMAHRLFPISMSDLKSRIGFHPLAQRQSIRLKSSLPVSVEARHSRAHPRDGVVLYRISAAGRSVVYATDVEGAKGGYDDVVEFARGADVLIHDAQYTNEEYYEGRTNKAGWGHTTVSLAAETARAAGVGKLLLYHHDPSRIDADVTRLERFARSIFRHSYAAREGAVISLSR